MGLRIHARGVARRDRHLVDRIEEIAEAAGRLIVGRLGGRLPHVDLHLTDSQTALRLWSETERAAVGAARAGTEDGDPSAWGRTVLAPRGVLITVNAERHARRDLVELDTTVVHELVHAVQLNQPRARTAQLAVLRHNHGIEHMTDRAARAANRTVERHEREARRLERLALHLP